MVDTALGAVGAFYYGKRISDARQKESQQALEELKAERADLKKMLEPFVDLAKQRFPTDQNDAALQKLAKDLEKLDARTSHLERKTEVPTLTDEQIKQVAKRIGSHAGTKVRIIRENTPDLAPFLDQLQRSFTLARWEIIENSISFDNAYEYISLFARGEKGSDPPPYVRDLYLALKDVGIEIEKVTGDSKMKEGVVGIQIGRRKTP